MSNLVVIEGKVLKISLSADREDAIRKVLED